MATSNSTLAAGVLRIVGVQLLPCTDDGEQVTPQCHGPDTSTSFWSVYERWSDGRATVVDDYASQAQALKIARALAQTHGVEIEPYPWVVALCRADGWNVMPAEGKGVGARRYQYSKNGGRGTQAGDTEFDAWLACLYHAAVCA